MLLLTCCCYSIETILIINLYGVRITVGGIAQHYSCVVTHANNRNDTEHTEYARDCVSPQHLDGFAVEAREVDQHTNARP